MSATPDQQPQGTSASSEPQVRFEPIVNLPEGNRPTSIAGWMLIIGIGLLVLGLIIVAVARQSYEPNLTVPLVMIALGFSVGLAGLQAIAIRQK